MKIIGTTRYGTSMGLNFGSPVSVEEATRHVGTRYTEVSGQRVDARDTLGTILGRQGGKVTTWGIFKPEGGSPLFYLTGPQGKQIQHDISQGYHVTPAETALLFDALEKEGREAPQTKGISAFIGNAIATFRRGKHSLV